ncbi:SDR family NAD(P)-dependent oxidoreductase [Chondromyces crocatus]|uniref:Short-chain dehydrogenase n=1 Tax=Chondromyces crocatus TaxID=52 RepID=A0A0K1EP83_CHOCO|nr:SDR family NAD(P)-dependent oxidoreductase [Chondromyces crocatus]AKT42467.1 uncharacterized protein CMC5_066930 [Chondromyces crocatus]
MKPARTSPETPPERDLQGASIAFLGGTSGIGLAAATAIASRGAAILLAGRDPDRGARAAQRVRDAGAADVTFLEADLLSLAGVARAADAIRAWRPALHGLVHTAMVAAPQRVDTPDGFERAFGLQYLARYALNRALLPTLVASGDGRIIHVGAKPIPAKLVPDLDDLQFTRRRWSLLPTLMSSQVLGYLHVQEATRRWHDLPVTATIACVGMTRTATVRDFPWYIRVLYQLFAETPESAARNVIRLLLDADTRRAKGAVIYNPGRFEPVPIRHDPALTERTWHLSEALARARGFAFPPAST